MKIALLTIICACLLLKSYSQKSLDTRVVVTVSDTTNLYEKTRLAFVNSGFMVVDNRRQDTLTMYPYNIKSTGYITAFASINNNQVVIWGFLGNANNNLLGITVAPTKNQYQKIYYYKGDKYWKKLVSVANLIGGTISYGKM